MITERDVPLPKRKEKFSPEEKLLQDFFRYIATEKISSKEMGEAYYRLWDVFEEGPTDARITEVLKKMHEMVQLGIPQNKFARIIERIDEFERGQEIFTEYVKTLGVTKNEEIMLLSIVKKKRSGKFSFTISGEQESFVEARLQVDPATPEGVLALKLKDKIEEVAKRVPKGKKLEITFEGE